MKNIVFAFLSTLILILAATADVRAQTVSGSVTDQNGAVVSGASVRLVNAQQLTIKAAESDASGKYRFDSVAAGTYLITASRPGFGRKSRSVIVSEMMEAVDLVLPVNQVTEQVTATADTGLVEDISKTPMQVNVVGTDAVMQRTTSVMAQAADEEVGVSLQRTSPTIGAVLVRGLTEVGVYVDGVRYTNSTQRGGINTFFNLNEPTTVNTVEVQRSPNTAQFGSDGLGGNVQILSRQPEYGFDSARWNGELNTMFNSADAAFGGNALVGYGAKRFGILGNLVGRRINTLRPGGGIDSHSAITRFLGLPSDIIGSERLPDTGFTQYGGSLQANLALRDDQQLSFRYQRSQQDGGKRYDQLIGGDGNLIADLRNLMLDFGYLRYYKQSVGFFDNLTANVSYNSQREERINQGGQGNPAAAITNDRERTTAWGFGMFLDKHFGRNNFLVGADHYHDKVTAPSFNTNPGNGVVSLVRPRVPNGSTYDLTGVYIQDVFEAVKNRLRLTGALRYNRGRYEAQAADAPVVSGQPLFPDDSATFKDFSGRIGTVVTITDGLNAAFNFSRGFRSPNITSLGGLGLVGVGFQVSTSSVIPLGGFVGTTANEQAVSSGVEVTPLRSEISNNYDVSLRYRNKRFDSSLTGFVIDYADTIVRQTLILPPGAEGLQLGSETITFQNINGAVFVNASPNPVLVQANFGNTRVKGTEATLEYRFLDSWVAGGNFSYVHTADKLTGAVPNLGGGGIPPAFGFVRLRYQPPGKRYWVEGYMNASGRQSRLSTLDIADRRTGGARTRIQIRNFIRRGACVRGLSIHSAGSPCGTTNNNYVLTSTGETLTQVLNRVLPIGAVINGVTVVDNNTVVPLFDAIPGYALFNLRGGYRFGENQTISVDFENIGDKSHRAPGWGIDGPGRSLTVRYQYRF
ncbi:MAG: TonB-dependent receptor [Pyrinomonadaceae bacterium]